MKENKTIKSSFFILSLDNIFTEVSIHNCFIDWANTSLEDLNSNSLPQILFVAILK
jgi:hypothetical protein